MSSDEDFYRAFPYIIYSNNAEPDDHDEKAKPATSHPGLEARALGHWQATIQTVVGEEGFTPYLTLKKEDLPTAEEVLDPENMQVDTFTIFDSLHAAGEWRSAQVVSLPAVVDSTIPTTDKQRKACVKLLFKAFKSTSAATDNVGMLKPFQEQRHDNARVECICWQLLHAIIRRTRSGPLLVAYDSAKTKAVPGCRTFVDRLSEVVTSMMQQKTICKHIYDAPYICTFVDDPQRARNRVASNRALNERKGLTMAVGKEIVSANSTLTSNFRRKRVKQTPKANESDDNVFEGEDVSHLSGPQQAGRQSPQKFVVPTRNRGVSETVTGNHPPAPHTPMNGHTYYSPPQIATFPGYGMRNSVYNPAAYSQSPSLGRGGRLNSTTTHGFQTHLASSTASPPTTRLAESSVQAHNDAFAQAYFPSLGFHVPRLSRANVQVPQWQQGIEPYQIQSQDAVNNEDWPTQSMQAGFDGIQYGGGAGAEPHY